MLRLIVLGFVIATAAWFFRYDVTRGSGPVPTYVLDRWTGNLSFCQGPRCYPVQTADLAQPNLFADLIPANSEDK